MSTDGNAGRKVSVSRKQTQEWSASFPDKVPRLAPSTAMFLLSVFYGAVITLVVFLFLYFLPSRGRP
jgi:hypothetical protein